MPSFTFSLLFSFWSSLQSFSSFSFSWTDLLNSVRPWSFSFCSISPRFLFFRFSRSRRFISAKCSVTRFCSVSIFCNSSILDIEVFNSRLAFLTSRSMGLHISKSIRYYCSVGLMQWECSVVYWRCMRFVVLYVWWRAPKTQRLCASSRSK